MIIIVLTFVVMLAAASLMMIGILRGRKLKGSCGGLNCASCKSVNACQNKVAKPAIDIREEP